MDSKTNLSPSALSFYCGYMNWVAWGGDEECNNTHWLAGWAQAEGDNEAGGNRPNRSDALEAARHYGKEN